MDDIDLRFVGLKRHSAPALKVAFSDFWPGFDHNDNYFYRILSLRFSVAVVVDDRPDVVIFSVFGNEHTRWRGRKIHFTGEARAAPPDTCDCSISFAAPSAKNFRLPLWAIYLDWFRTPYSNGNNPSYLVPLDRVLGPRRPVRRPRFCNFIHNNPAGERLRFLSILRSRRPVDCLGTLANQGARLGGDERTKLEAQANFRFSVAFENTIAPGYVTEKILHALAAGTVPLYWGSEEVKRDFNPKAFLDARDFASLEDLADAAVAIDDDEGRLLERASEPAMDEESLRRVAPAALADFFEAAL